MSKRNSLNNIKLAFLLNLFFSILELVGGIFTNSISIISDSVHDFADAMSIAIAVVLEKKSKKDPDNVFTYGYLRFSVLGALITATILLVGSVFVIYNAIPRLINPEEVNYDGMIILAIIGVIINFVSTKVTSHSHNVNEKVVSLHMLEDVLGWVAVLIGSICIKLFNLYIIDPILSLGITIFILFHVFKNYKFIFDIFMEKIPENINIDELKSHLSSVEKVKDIHHIHVWTMDGNNNYATFHVLVDEEMKAKDLDCLKCKLRKELNEHNISHSVIEFEAHQCDERNCKINPNCECCSHIGHHHHH